MKDKKLLFDRKSQVLYSKPYKKEIRAKAGCDKRHDYEMTVAPYDKDKPIYYEFTDCPAAEYAIKNSLTAIMIHT